MKFKKLILLMIPAFLLAGCNGDDKKEKAPLNPKEVLYEYFLRDGSGDGKYKTVYTYDDKGNEIISEGYDADLDSNDFVLTRKIERTYNDNGDIVKEVSNDIDNGVSTLNYKCVTTFDNKGNVVKEEFYDLDDEGNEYTDIYYDDYKYDSLNRLLSVTFYRFNEEENKYVEDGKDTYTYKDNFVDFIKCESTDSLGLTIIRELDEKGRIVYDYGYSEYYSSLNYYSYNESGHETSERQYMYDEETGTYVIQGIFVYNYIDGEHLYNTSFVYFGDNSNVRLHQKTEYEYDDDMNLLKETEYEYDFETEDFFISSRVTYTY